MIIISAMTDRRVIGARDGMPWSVPEEYQRYLDTVCGAAVLMGRRSYDIFAADLAGVATPIKVSSQPARGDEIVAASLADALAIAEKLEGETFVAGGARLYADAIPIADAMYLSTIHGDFDGDTFFPEFDPSAWEVARHEQHERYDFREYRRRAGSVSDRSPAP